MGQVIQTEKRKRGFFGWVFLLLFWGFNALMVAWLFAAGGAVSDATTSATSEAEQAGAAIGTAIGFSFLISIWMAGAVILGIFVLLTRGTKTIITTEVKQ